MTPADEVLAVLHAYPDCVINYHDRGGWAIYSREEWDRWQADEVDEPETLYDGDDYGGTGFIPFLVEVLAQKNDLEVVSE